jgi:hypothetical protein
MRKSSLAYAYLQSQYSVEQIVGGDSQTIDVPYVEYVLSFLKNDY